MKLLKERVFSKEKQYLSVSHHISPGTSWWAAEIVIPRSPCLQMYSFSHNCFAITS